MESNAQGTTDPKEKPRRLFAARLKMNEPGGQKRTARLSSIPRPVRSLTCPSRFPKSRCEGFLVAALWGGQKACFPSPHPVTHSWDSSAAAPSAMQINRQEEVAKGLFAINTRKRGWYLNAQKPGMICRMAGESGQDLGKARQGENSLPFPSLPITPHSSTCQLPSPTTQTPTQTTPLPSTTLTVPTTMQAASAGAKPNPRPPPCILRPAKRPHPLASLSPPAAAAI